MFRSLNSLVRRVLFAALVATSTSAVLAQGPGAPKEPQIGDEQPQVCKLEMLLEEAGFRYTKDDDGRYYVTIEVDGEASVVTLYEQEMGWKDDAGNPVKLIFGFRKVVGFPEGYEPSISLCRKVFELNDGKYFGQLLLNEYGIFMVGSMWEKSATAEDVWTLIVLFHNDGEANEKELKPFVTAATDEE